VALEVVELDEKKEKAEKKFAKLSKSFDELKKQYDAVVADLAETTK